jgi:hypothetical protein
MSSTHAAAIRVTDHPVSVGFCENPKPGSDGTTTSNESSTFPPNAAGSVSGPISFRNSAIEPGQPWVKMRGIAFGFLDLAWMKWISSPSIVVRNCGKRLSSDSNRRQSYSRSQ